MLTKFNFPILTSSSPSIVVSFICIVTEKTEWERLENKIRLFNRYNVKHYLFSTKYWKSGKEDLNTQRKTTIKPGMTKFLPATYNTDHNRKLSKQSLHLEHSSSWVPSPATNTQKNLQALLKKRSVSEQIAPIQNIAAFINVISCGEYSNF